MIAVRRCPGAAAFLALAEPFLLREEAAHNLMLGIAGEVRSDPGRFGDQPPFFAVVLRDGAVIGAAFRTPPHHLGLSQMPPEASPALAAVVNEEYATLPGFLAPTEVAEAFANEWRQRTGQPFAKRRAERVFALDTVVPPRPASGAPRRATVADRDLLLAWIGAFEVEAKLPALPEGAARDVDRRLGSAPETTGFWLWEDKGRAVSLVGYGGLTAHGIRIGPVYTPPEQRGRGYASANVTALSQWLLDHGRQFCFLFTDLANPTSNAIYRQIGYRPVCDMDEYAFLSASGTI